MSIIPKQFDNKTMHESCKIDKNYTKLLNEALKKQLTKSYITELTWIEVINKCCCSLLSKRNLLKSNESW